VSAPPGAAAVTGPADAPDAVELDEPMLKAWGERIGREVAAPVVLALRGQLGAGKSVLARAVARGAGVSGHMPSPTFNLLYRYRAARGVDVVHLDLYRLEDPSEVWELGWAELGAGAEIVLVEWPDRAEALLPSERWDIWLEIPAEEALMRVVRVRRLGAAPPLPIPPGPGEGA
jgi:tRNA threonylcarbamoyladenosine biosynthesis protein TsaE